ncbi:MAG: cardiolipin synthase [Bacillota bacterium]|nr:MAG: cardiolipin synthase [Bacillota bacterium]
MNRLLRMVVSRAFFIFILFIIQLGIFFFLINYIASFSYLNTVFYIISIIIVIYMLYREENPVYKLSWIIPILLFPLFGGLFYLFYQERNVSKRVLRRHEEIDKNRYDYVKDIPNPLKNKDSIYLERLNWPTYQHTEVTFHPSGEELYENLLRDLKQAESFIFLEYFIINKGHMWSEMLALLQEKARLGVEVKILYDDFGSSELPFNYHKKINEPHLEIRAFNRMRLHINFAQNYRDHRKICVIDGKVGYTGGINIGDEYINLVKRFGHWHDAGIRLEGDAVWSLTIGFLENWRFSTKKEIDYNTYKVNHHMVDTGYIIPFSDTPIDKETTIKNVFLSLISSAKKSIRITTPYLIIDNELMTSLKYASKSGVDVSIIIPYVPDKKIIFMVTETYLPELIASGVKVYRYLPGFIHSKMIIADDYKALIGTANLDFRSLYLHFENMVYIEEKKAIKDMVTFFEETKEKSQYVTDFSKRNIFYRLIQIILKGFSSLM